MIEIIPIITIDGPVGSGKSTAAERVAAELNLAHYRASNFYRLLGAKLLEQTDKQALLKAAEAIRPAIMFQPLADAKLMREEVGQAAALIGNDKQFYPVFMALARSAAVNLPAGKRGLIADGRALGSEVFKGRSFNAGVKIFLTAAPDIRALRAAGRQHQRSSRTLEQQIKARDEADMQRTFLRLASFPGAIEIDSSKLSTQEVTQRILAHTLQRYPALRVNV